MPFILLMLLFYLLTASNAVTPQRDDDHIGRDTIDRDVIIIGGGSSGTYAAISLDRLGYSVALIEKEPILGGQVNTYHDPISNKTVDFGVLVFSNITVVIDYFNYLDISVTPLDEQSSKTSYADFRRDGKLLQIPNSVAWANESARTSALISYSDILSAYPYLANGFDLPDPVPQDLLLSWGSFLKKYKLDALAYFALNLVEGFGNILDQPALYVMKWFGELTVDSLLGKGVVPLTTKNHDNQEIYEKALFRLGTNAFVSSHVTAIERQDSGVKVSVSTPLGDKLFVGKKLLIAIPPTINNLRGLGLDLESEEEMLFAQFYNSFYWNMIIKNTGIPDDVEIDNVDVSSPLGLPSLPGLYGFRPSGLPSFHDALYGSPYYISEEEVKADVLATLSKVVKANGYKAESIPEIVGFANHSPFEPMVSTEAIRNGVYDCLNKLQGKRNTWWTGATWQTQDSPLIWNWTEYNLLPKIVADL